MNNDAGKRRPVRDLLYDLDHTSEHPPHPPKRRRVTLSMRIGVLDFLDDLAARSGFSRSFLVNLICWQYRRWMENPEAEDLMQIMLQEARSADAYGKDKANSD
jgi:hypothetical protein